ncbi:uncharacterized protein PV07_05428 [Cladophialophora immunda]|uniref:Uncharacterized protein n=1 Tax=Cladophialophora immunda TaxID=569365 RepID=A0A0D2CHH0_9EURO|nr:uncharacterized protein PV07_05428 [Cladophialophora immunda]KIW29625.1 hypothetical protein PV07_05428 [Cladophialophora immunda]
MGVVGDQGVGKSRLIHQYLWGKFMDDYQDECIYQKLIVIGPATIDLKIIGIQASQCKILKYDAVIFVFDTQVSSTLDMIEAYTERLDTLQQCPSHALVGTKTDCDPQQVRFETGSALAEALCAEYSHLSAFNEVKVQHLFDIILRQRIDG